MSWRDIFAVSFGNLSRMKLRVALTVSGVVIAIGALVSMVSFGAGNQERIEDEFSKLGLLTTMHAYPLTAEPADTSAPAPLDSVALARISSVPGVNIVYPYDALGVMARLGDSLIETKAQGLYSSAAGTKLFSHYAAGGPFPDDSGSWVIVTPRFLREAGISNPDSAVGMRIAVSVNVSRLDSGLAHLWAHDGVTLLDRARQIELDSLFESDSRSKILRTEAGEIIRRFAGGFLNARASLIDTLTICGVREEGSVGRRRIDQLLVPVHVVREFKRGGFGGSPVELMTSLTSGGSGLFDEDTPAGSYPQATIDFDQKVPYGMIRDSVKALGFRVFSFAEQFEEIQRVFLYLDMALGMVGIIALVTASLGIANTMVMSVSERRREIGILKSLGADNGAIRRLFMAESAAIGLIGSAGGIGLGWIISRIVSAVARSFMEREGIPPIELFSLPFWLVLIALGVGTGVSLAAGLLPAIRASRVDPVAALRME